MKDLDKRIEEALRREDADFIDDFNGEPSIYEMIMEAFRGRHRWFTLMGVFWSIVFMVLAVLSAVRFFHAEQTRSMLIWAAACIICLSGVSMMKVWFWMELNKNAITREIKRLELQIVRLAARVKDGAESDTDR